MHALTQLRPAWTPGTIALTIVGFMAWWPLGLAMLAYIFWGNAFAALSANIRRLVEQIFATGKVSLSAAGPSGNIAFDEWREAELALLAEQRQALDARLPEFEEFLRERRRAVDQVDFERFMAITKEDTQAALPRRRAKHLKAA